MSSSNATGRINFNGLPAVQRFVPEPHSSVGFAFSDVLSTVGDVAAGAISTVAPGAVAGLDSGYQELLNKQIEVQMQMQILSFESNIEKSKHETKMTAIRNIRAN